MKTKQLRAEDFITPLTINGLRGRVLNMPSTKKTRKREILMIYGHHASLERVFTMAQNLTDYGNVTVPDLPGFGGMDSFYVLNEKPTLDNMADYLATFIKLRYKNSSITICGMSWGFVVTTYMLQKYPSLAKQVDLVVSVVGFVHGKDFMLKPRTLRQLSLLSRTFRGPVGSTFFRYVLLAPPVIKATYKLQAKTHPKMKDADKDELNMRVNFEVTLWHANDVRTQMYTGKTMLKLDLTHNKVAVPVVHIRVDSDQYFNNDSVQKHLKLIFTDVRVATAHMPNHAPTVVEDVKGAGAIFPPAVRKILAKKP